MSPARVSFLLILTFIPAERLPQAKWKIVRYSINIVKPYIVSTFPRLYLYFTSGSIRKTDKRLRHMKDSLLALGSALIMVLAGSAAHANPSQTISLSDEDTTYTRVITERSGKIVATLGLPDSAAFYRVRAIVTDQYRALNAIDTHRDSLLKQHPSDSLKKIIRQDADTKIAGLHAAYLKKLATQLDSQQIDKIKDGMTYNVRTVTYNAYVKMIPQLTDQQKAVIMADLIEAREHAMDGGSSKEKHAWFGKYKGRINNYLSTQGIDEKQVSKQAK